MYDFVDVPAASCNTPDAGNTVCIMNGSPATIGRN